MSLTRRICISLLFLACGLAIGLVLRSRRADGVSAERTTTQSAPPPPPAAKRAVLSQNARTVLAWLRRGLPEPDHFMELPPITLEDLERVEALTSGEFADLLAAADPPRNRLLMERWAEVDAKAFVEWLTPYARRHDPTAGYWIGMSEPGSPVYLTGLMALARVDPATAGQLGNSLGGAWARFFNPGTTAAPVSTPPPPPTADPDLASMPGDDAWRWLKDKRRTQDVSTIAEALQKTDPARAVAWLEDMPVSYDRERLMRTALLAAAKSPDTIFGLLDKFASGADLHYALRSCDGLGRDHFSRLADWARQCDDPDKRSSAFRWMAEKATSQGSLDKAEAWLAELPPGPDRWTALEVMTIYFPDPGRAARQLVEDAPAAGETAVLASLTSNWATKDRDAAMAWAQSLADGPLRSQAMTGAWAAWTDADRAASQEAAMSLSGGDRTAALRGIAWSNWGAQYPDQAMKWITSLPPPDQPAPFAAAFSVERMEGRLHPGVLPVLSSVAAEPVPVEDQPALARMARAVAHLENRRDAAAATRWALALPPGEVRREVILVLTDIKFDNSWDEGLAWTNALPADDRRTIEE